MSRDPLTIDLSRPRSHFRRRRTLLLRELLAVAWIAATFGAVAALLAVVAYFLAGA